jgi:type II secretory pathway pseudopilin PulG
MTRRPAAEGGFSLLDLLLTVSILGIVVLVSTPPLMRATAELRLRMAASEASRIFAAARSYAVRHSANVGVKFHPGENGAATTWSLHLDGDGDGVRTADLRDGTDPAVPGAGNVVDRPASFASGIGFGFPEGPLPRDPGGRRLTRRDDPIRFNNSDVAAFGPLGTSTPGSLYLTDGERLAAVRVTNRTGRVRVLLYDAERGEWR